MDAYIFQADIYCEDCAAKIDAPHDNDMDSDEAVCGPYADGGGESDTPDHCANCGLFLENPLTQAGYEYVREQAAFGINSVVSEWLKFYEIDLEEN